jgi:hypothetical protein
MHTQDHRLLVLCFVFVILPAHHLQYKNNMPDALILRTMKYIVKPAEKNPGAKIRTQISEFPLIPRCHG